MWRRRRTARFSVVAEEVDRARRELGIKAPVSVRLTSYPRSNLRGRYVALKDGRHRISVSRGLGAAEASEVIWHELAHARQAEELGGDEAFDRQWWMEAGRAGVTREQVRNGTPPPKLYDSMPLESEAVEVANENWRRMLTVKRPRRAWRKGGR